MKANELMIGDWVYNCIADIRFQVYPQFFSQWHNRPEQFGATIQPISLTPEILEKNGFEKQQFGNFIYENDDVNLRIEFCPKNINYTNGRYDYIDIEKGCVTITEMPIEFVHELQHALRLCGIDKTIGL